MGSGSNVRSNNYCYRSIPDLQPFPIKIKARSILVGLLYQYHDQYHSETLVIEYNLIAPLLRRSLIQEPIT